MRPAVGANTPFHPAPPCGVPQNLRPGNAVRPQMATATNSVAWAAEYMQRNHGGRFLLGFSRQASLYAPLPEGLHVGVSQRPAPSGRSLTWTALPRVPGRDRVLV